MAGQPLPGLSVRLVRRASRPDGWAGKVWAMEQGLAAAGQPEYVLFTDADIGYAPGTLTAPGPRRGRRRRGLVSQMALLRAETAWERLIVPAFVYFFAQLYPFRRVNRPRRADGRGGRAGACWCAARSWPRRAAWPDPRRADRRRGARPRCSSAPGARCWLGPDHGRAPAAGRTRAGRAVGHGGPQRLHPAALLPAAAGRHAGRAGLAVPAAAGRRPSRAWPPPRPAAGPAALATAAAGLAGWALHDGQLRAHAAPVPASPPPAPWRSPSPPPCTAR